MNKPHPDTLRLKALVKLFYQNSGDFAQYIFHATRKDRTEMAIFRRALDQWIKDGRA